MLISCLIKFQRPVSIYCAYLAIRPGQRLFSRLVLAIAQGDATCAFRTHLLLAGNPDQKVLCWNYRVTGFPISPRRKAVHLPREKAGPLYNECHLPGSPEPGSRWGGLFPLQQSGWRKNPIPIVSARWNEQGVPNWSIADLRRGRGGKTAFL